MGIGGLYGPTIIMVCGFATICLLNVIMAELASWRFGRLWLWLLLFFMLPGVSHIFCLLLIWYVYRRERTWRMLRAASDSPERAELGIEGSPFEAIPNIQITPFSELEGIEQIRLDLEHAGILGEWHDRRIDELMEWDQWEKALERARECLAAAQEAGDRQSIDLYEAYLAFLRGRVLGLQADGDVEPPAQ